jgi:hypothetical protein
MPRELGVIVDSLGIPVPQFRFDQSSLILELLALDS